MPYIQLVGTISKVLFLLWLSSTVTGAQTTLYTEEIEESKGSKAAENPRESGCRCNSHEKDLGKPGKELQ